MGTPKSWISVGGGGRPGPAVSHWGPGTPPRGPWVTLLASPSSLRDFHSSLGAETWEFGWKAPPALLGIPEIQDLCSRPELHGGGSWTNMQSRLLCEPQAIPFLSHQDPNGTCLISPQDCAHRVLLPSLTTTTPGALQGSRPELWPAGLWPNASQASRHLHLLCQKSTLPALPCLVQVQLMTIFLAFTCTQLQGLVQVPACGHVHVGSRRHWGPFPT